jgi:phage shock protein C
MFCSRCGKQHAASRRSCPACGMKTPSPEFFQSSGQMQRPLTHRVLGGVCAAFALHYGWKLSRVRFITVLLTLFTCVGGIAYLAAWFVIPAEQYQSRIQSI